MLCVCVYIYFHDFKTFVHLYLITTDNIPSQLFKTFCSNTLKIQIQTRPEWHILQRLA